MTSMSKYISDYFGVEPGSKVHLAVYSNSLKYLTKTITSRELHTRLKKLSSKSIKIFRLKLVNEGYYLLNVKMWLIHAYANARNTSWSSSNELRKMDIMKKDRQYLPMFTQDSELRKQIRTMLQQLGGRLGIPTISDLKALLAEIMISAEVKLKPLINNIIWTKLKFLIHCGSLDIESVRGEFKAKMIQTFYWLAPYRKENLNHWVMSMIKPIKNHAINIVNFYTTKKRTRMVEEDGVYRVVEVELDANSEDQACSDFGATSKNIEAQIVAKQIIARYGITQKRIRAFKLMSGIFDAKFTAWLKDHKHIGSNSNLDNTDFQEQAPNKLFIRLVSQYVKLDWLYLVKLISRIKQQLQEEGNGYGTKRRRFACA